MPKHSGYQTFPHRLRLRLFVHQYIRARGNASEAARQVGYHGKPESIRVSACRLLKQARAEGLIDRVCDRDDIFLDLFPRLRK